MLWAWSVYGTLSTLAGITGDYKSPALFFYIMQWLPTI